jgi:CheY-like chemotaxis protein
MGLKILIADDEKDIANTYAEMLELRGHQVVVSFNGGDCVTEYLSAIKDKEKPPYDVVIIDHAMPVLNGAKVARKILEINPKQQIIFVSGYGSDLLTSLSGISHVDFLTKPVVPQALIKLVEG